MSGAGRNGLSRKLISPMPRSGAMHRGRRDNASASGWWQRDKAFRRQRGGSGGAFRRSDMARVAHMESIGTSARQKLVEGERRTRGRWTRPLAGRGGHRVHHPKGDSRALPGMLLVGDDRRRRGISSQKNQRRRQQGQRGRTAGPFAGPSSGWFGGSGHKTAAGIGRKHYRQAIASGQPPGGWKRGGSHAIDLPVCRLRCLGADGGAE